MSSRHMFALAAAAALWVSPAFAWEPEIVGLDEGVPQRVEFIGGAVDAAALATPEVVGSDRQEPTAPKDANPGERLAHDCTCR